MESSLMDGKQRQTLNRLTAAFLDSGIAARKGFAESRLYALAAHSTAIEGSALTEREAALLFAEGRVPAGRSQTDILMNLDLKGAYEQAFRMPGGRQDLTVRDLQGLSAAVMKNTGSRYSTVLGAFDASAGDLRLVNVHAGRCGKSFLPWQEVPAALERFCAWLTDERKRAQGGEPALQYELSFEAHYRLVQIHPWADGNGRVSRLLMNALQRECGLLPVIVRRGHREPYIAALEEAENAGNSRPFIDFMCRETAADLKRCLSGYKAYLK